MNSENMLQQSINIEDWVDKIVVDATQTPASFKTLLFRLYNSPNLHLTEKLDVTVRKVARDPPRHTVTLIGTNGDITLFIDFVSQELSVTFTIVDGGIKMEKSKVLGEFKILKTAKYFHESDSSGEDGSSHSHSGTSSISDTSSEKGRRSALQVAFRNLVNNPLIDRTQRYRFMLIANDDQIKRLYLADMDNEEMRDYVQVFLEDRPILK